ncbi:vWA domain-containing protein [Methanocaldococcus sp. 16A]
MIRYDKYDKMVWERCKDKITFHLSEKETEMIFYLFFKYEIEILEENDLIKKIVRDRRFKNIKSITTLDENYSLIATEFFCEKFKEFKDKCKEEDIDELLDELESYMESITSSFSSCGQGKGYKSHSDPKKKLELTEKLLKNNKLKEFVKVLGKFRRITIKKYKTKIKHFSGEKYSINFGNNLVNLLPSEYRNFAEETLFIDLLRRYNENRLLNYKILENNENCGDFIVCLDLSGSMRGNKEIWAKTIALCLMDISLKRNKRYIAILFDDGVRDIKIYEKKVSFEEILEFASVFYGGGTNFEKPLREALKFNGDIVFITDGECEISLEFLEKIREEKMKRKIKIYSICINTKPTVSLKQISDVAITIYELTSKTAEKVFDILI